MTQIVWGSNLILPGYMPMFKFGLDSQLVRLMFRLSRSNWGIAGWAIVFSLVMALLEVCSAALITPLITTLGGSSLVAGNTSGWITWLMSLYQPVPSHLRLGVVAASFLLVTLLKNICKYLGDTRINQFQLKVGSTLRQQCVERFLELELSFYNKSNIGELLSYVSEQAQRGEQLFSRVLEMTSNLLIVTLLFGLLVVLSPLLTLITVGSLSIVFVLLKSVMGAVQANGREATRSLEAFSIFMSEMLSGLRVVKSYGQETAELGQASRLLQQRYQTELRAFRWNSMVVPLTETAGIGVLLVLIVLGASLTGNGSLPFLLTYFMALLRILPRVSHLSSLRSQFALLSSSLEIIQQFLMRTEADRLPDGDRVFSGLRDQLTLRGLTFSFPGNAEPTLRTINLVVRRGETVALVGASGSGKSTLVDLLMRFYDPDSGGILVDDLDLRQLERQSWRSRIAMVSQDTFLFNATVRENIAYGKPDATDWEVVTAAQQAYADKFIQKLPHGYDTIVGNRGAQLSGGQRQRIAIARAILRNPDILILDEATSALDTQSERIVQKALEEVSRDRTVIVIAHRLSTVRNADTIVVLQQGQIVEQGTHQELIALKGLYFNLEKVQGLDTTIYSNVI
jgi:ATP-binding cassette, subfamily B, bacterial MsbA